VERIDERAALVLGHRVDRQVASHQVFLERDLGAGVEGEAAIARRRLAFGAGERVLLAGRDVSFRARLDEAFRRVVARPPSAREAEALRRHFEAQIEVYRAAPDDARKLAAVGLHPASPDVDAVELAAWTSVARVLLNLNETIVVY
jgi:hypothetical protein